ISPGCCPTILVLEFLTIPAPCTLGLASEPTKSSAVWLMPHTLALRLRAVRNNWTTSGANTGESSKNQHSSRMVMLGCPVLPEALWAVACAINKLIAVSRRGSSASCSTLKNNQGLSSEIVRSEERRVG